MARERKEQQEWRVGLVLGPVMLAWAGYGWGEVRGGPHCKWAKVTMALDGGGWGRAGSRGLVGKGGGPWTARATSIADRG